jgi:Leucine-rich repeat (LRR) protein
LALNLQGNKLQFLPKELFASLPQLVSLSAANNEIKEIPAFDDLARISTVDLSNNHISIVQGQISSKAGKYFFSFPCVQRFY